MGAPHPHLRASFSCFLWSVFKLHPEVQKNPADGLGIDTVIKMTRPDSVSYEPPFKVKITFYPSLRSSRSSSLANMSVASPKPTCPYSGCAAWYSSGWTCPSVRRAGDGPAPTRPSPPSSSVYLAKFKPPPPPSQSDPLARCLATRLAAVVAFPEFFVPAVAVASFCAA